MTNTRLASRGEIWRTARLPGLRAFAPTGTSLEGATLLVSVACLLLAFLPGPPFRLEQFDLPKDLALGIAGCVSALLLLEGPVPWQLALDAPLAVCLALGAVLTLTVATNAAFGWHVVGLFSASALLFMAARRVGANNGTRFAFPVISGLLLVVLVVVLFEAFGGIPLMSSPGHRPGATLGNRNLAARVACLSLPLLWYQLVLAKRNIAHCIFAVIVASAVAVIVISRSRGAFVVACAQLIAIPMAARWWVDKPIVPSVRRASLLWAMAVAIGVTSAVVLPNQLRWSASDLIFSAKRVSDFRTGSGRGRVIQAETTMRMIGATGLRGVGPGNWSTWYPGYAAPGDPSVRLGSFYPAPLIPRNDILGFLAEFGLFGFALAVASIIALLAETAAMIRQPDVSQRYLGLLIVAILIANFLLGLFDSVLRVATTVGLSAIVVGLALGASAQNISPLTERRPGSAAIRRLVVLAYACGALALARGAWQDFAALRIITAAHTVGDMYRAVSAAPNNIEAQMLLGYVLIGVKRCDLAQPHLTQVARLEPYSLAVKALQKQCPGWSSGFRGGSGSVSE